MAKAAVDQAANDRAPKPVLVFNDAASEVIELDWRGTVGEFKARFVERAAQLDSATKHSAGDNLPGDAANSDSTPSETTEQPPRGPGRPKLGVVAREVTLLPRHWEWLGTQPGGASVALRKLVEVARRSSEVKDRVRNASNVGYKFMSTMAGHEPGFEEASRALFAGDQAGFEALIAEWPTDVQAHLRKILADAFWA